MTKKELLHLEINRHRHNLENVEERIARTEEGIEEMTELLNLGIRQKKRQ